MVDYYVSSTGDDANDGSAERPWQTLQKAADNALPGTTIHVAPGFYQQPDGASLTSRKSGTAQARISFVSDVTWGALIRSQGAEFTWTNYGDYVDIIGFDVSGDGRIGILNNGSFCTVQKNHVHDIPAALNANVDTGGHGGAGIDHNAPQGHDNDTIANLCHDIGTGINRYVHGIYHANQRGHVYNNISYRNSGWGIQFWHAATEVIVANNLCFENRGGGITVGSGDFPPDIIIDHMIVANNIVVYNQGSTPGINSAGLFEYWKNGRCGDHNRYLNNLVYGNSPTNVSLKHPESATGTISADPQFVNYQPDGSGDYHLSPGSPCIGAGTTIGAPPYDYDGVVRRQGWKTTVDIGPFEYTPVANTSVPGS